MINTLIIMHHPLVHQDHPHCGDDAEAADKKINAGPD